MEVDSERTPLLRERSLGAGAGANQARSTKATIVDETTGHVQRSRVAPLQEPEIKLVPQPGPETDRFASMWQKLRSLPGAKVLAMGALAVATVVWMVVFMVVTPLYTGTFSSPETGSDAYIAILLAALWFPVVFFGQLFIVRLTCDRQIPLRSSAPWSNIAFTGMLMASNGVLLGLTSPPDRTPAYLQGLLQTLLVPFTVLARALLLRKCVSRGEMLCLFCLLAGLFISLEPTIFHLDPEEGGGGGAWYFPLLFGLCWLPAALGYVCIEKGQQNANDSIAYMAWLQVFLYSSYILFIWTDFIPGFGMAKSPADFLNRLKRGLLCMYGGDPRCSHVPATAALYILSYSLGNMFNLLLIRYAESAVYSVVVLALVTPLSTLFWTLFSPTPSFHWRPEFSSSTVYLLVGLAIMTPSVVMYTLLGSAREAATATPPATTPRAASSKVYGSRSSRATRNSQPS